MTDAIMTIQIGYFIKLIIIYLEISKNFCASTVG